MGMSKKQLLVNNCKCIVCGNEFHRKESQIKRYNVKYCSIKCKHIGIKKITRICPICEKEFIITPSQLRTKNSGMYCSRKCWGNSKTIKEIRICGYCKKEFIVTSGEIRKGGGKHCSKDCYSKSMNGSGNPNWQGGITSKNILIRNSQESIDWRNLVFKRDNYTCQHCGDNNGGNLQAHHIIPFSVSEKLRFDISNGITLCIKCHRKEHNRLSQARTNQLDIFATNRKSII